jgi:hypothetical protein
LTVEPASFEPVFLAISNAPFERVPVTEMRSFRI